MYLLSTKEILGALSRANMIYIFRREKITVAMEPCRGWRGGVGGGLHMKLDFSQKLIGSLAPI